jgi:hypothetical protein
MKKLVVLLTAATLMGTGCYIPCAHQGAQGQAAAPQNPQPPEEPAHKLPAERPTDKKSKSHQMKFQCARGKVLLHISFATDQHGHIKGVFSKASPNDIESVVFFLDGHRFEDCPAAKFNKSVTLSLPSHATGNLLLRLKNGKKVWANLGNNGRWQIEGAKKNGKGYLISSCSR